jgi:hypothetical protein
LQASPSPNPLQALLFPQALQAPQAPQAPQALQAQAQAQQNRAPNPLNEG